VWRPLCRSNQGRKVSLRPGVCIRQRRARTYVSSTSPSRSSLPLLRHTCPRPSQTSDRKTHTGKGDAVHCPTRQLAPEGSHSPAQPRQAATGTFLVFQNANNGMRRTEYGVRTAPTWATRARYSAIGTLSNVLSRRTKAQLLSLSYKKSVQCATTIEPRRLTRPLSASRAMHSHVLLRSIPDYTVRLWSGIPDAGSALLSTADRRLHDSQPSSEDGSLSLMLPRASTRNFRASYLRDALAQSVGDPQDKKSSAAPHRRLETRMRSSTISSVMLACDEWDTLVAMSRW
jgi:hypothetical protein